jgi:predicted DNA-binding transcriptional regulator AlpA
MSTVTGHDLMDVDEVADAFGVTRSSLHVALSTDQFPSLTRRLPAPLRRIGRSWVWARADVEAALAVNL